MILSVEAIDFQLFKTLEKIFWLLQFLGLSRRQFIKHATFIHGSGVVYGME
jgi:hypothetical protein